MHVRETTPDSSANRCKVTRRGRIVAIGFCAFAAAGATGTAVVVAVHNNAPPEVGCYYTVPQPLQGEAWSGWQLPSEVAGPYGDAGAARDEIGEIGRARVGEEC